MPSERKKGEVVEGIKPPAALRPGVDWDGEDGEITSDPLNSPNPDWDAILRRWGYDPDVYEIVEPVKVSEWEVQNSEGVQTLWSYKAGVRTRDKIRDFDFNDLIREVKSHRKSPKPAPVGEEVFLINVADTQFGKNDGDGVKGTVDRFLESTDRTIDRIKELRKIGRPIDKAVIAGLGDIIEGCDGQYASQAFNVEINRRQQNRLARRLIRDLIIRVADEVNELTVLAVPGNHGENRKDGRAYTTPGDNDDVAIFEEIGDILAANPKAYGHVKFIVPEEEIFVMMNIAGTNVGFAHGHIAGSGASPQKKLWDWWGGQIIGGQPLKDAKILITGHYHHFSIVEYNMDRIHIQCPSLESESTWWKNLKGQVSPPGVLTMVITATGYKDLQVV